jgi:ATP-dependent helicase/nuclease subunit B
VKRAHSGQLELDFSRLPQKPKTEATTRVFLDWRVPALETTADWLLAKAPPHDRVIDLQQYVACLPSARAGRRLLERLVDRAEQKHRGLLPPQIVTLGALPELLYVCEEAVATDEQRLLAWAEAVSANDVTPLTAGSPLSDPRALAATLMSLQDNLALARLSFAEVCDRAKEDDPVRRERWRLLQTLCDAQNETLAAAGFIDVHAARERALKSGAVFAEKSIVLVSCVDLPPFMHAMLRSIAAHVTPLVFAPERMRDRFDDLGALQTMPWLNAQIDVPASAIHFCSSAREQGAAVRDAIAALAEDVAIDEVTVAVLDEEVIAPIESELAEEGVAVHLGMPRPFSASAPARLLLATRDFLVAREMRAFSVWARHPDVEKKLHMGPRLLDALDTLRTEHFVETFAPPFLGRPHEQGLLVDLHGRALDLLGPLAHEDEASLATWAEETVRFIARVYGSLSLSKEHPAERALLDALEALMALCERLAVKNALTARQMKASSALDWICFMLKDATLAPPPIDVAIEAVGWLDVLLDDAPAMVVTSMNDGFVPEAVNADAFLPNAMRTKLGLIDNDRRHARDAYILSAALATKPDISLVVGSRTLVGDPLLPSRLLFACDAETAAKRLQAFAAHERLAPPRELRAASRIEVPMPLPLERPIDTMTVSSFRSYLACPYRFYLRHVCHLYAVNDEQHELDAGQFGTLAHLVLNDFGTSPTAASSDAKEIKQLLDAALRERSLQTFGASPPTAVRLQLSQLAERLSHFAIWQARWSLQGWRIKHCELELKNVPFMVDGEPMGLRGKIDRVDEHPDGRVMVFDYKTSDKPKPPDLVHRRKGVWVDLQLPLYRKLWRSTGDVRPITLAYMSIAPSLHETKELPAAWSIDELNAADALAEEVVRKVRAGAFSQITRPAPRFSEEYAAICQDGQLVDDEEVEP